VRTRQILRVYEDTDVMLLEKIPALQKERQSVRREDDLDRVRNLEREIVRVDVRLTGGCMSYMG